MRVTIDDDRYAKAPIVVLLTRLRLIGTTRVSAYTLIARGFPFPDTRAR
jgi:hypothetical protein